MYTILHYFVYGNDLEFTGVSFNFPLFFECVDILLMDHCVARTQLFGLKAWEIIFYLPFVVSVCNVVCVGCWWGWGDVTGVKIEWCG